MYFFSISLNEIKKATCFCGSLTPATFWLACFFNSVDYMQKRAEDRMLACVAKCKFYARI